MTSPPELPTFYIPHGAGPCFFMDWSLGAPDTWDHMAQWLSVGLPKAVGIKPKALVVFSAHWECKAIRINGHATPSLIYDYYGFPEQTYLITYPAPGEPGLAQEIQSLLIQAGITASIDDTHGLDHGVFIPLKLSYPQADIPIVQVSLKEGLDPETHFQLGRALKSLRGKGVLIIGSGMSYHNMQMLMQSPKKNDISDRFDEWLTETCTASPDARQKQLIAWESAPFARQAHPREEHLLPLMVAAGAASEEPGYCIFTDRVMGATVSAYQFGETLDLDSLD